MSTEKLLWSFAIGFFVWCLLNRLADKAKAWLEKEAQWRVMMSFDLERDALRADRLMHIRSARFLRDMRRRDEQETEAAEMARLIREDQERLQREGKSNSAGQTSFDMRRAQANAIERRNARRLSRLKKPYR